MDALSRKTLNILVDGYGLLPGERGAGGAGRYFHSLLKEWNRKKLSNIRIVASPLNYGLLAEYKNLSTVVVPNQEHWAYIPHFNWADVYVSLLNGLWPRIIPPQLPVVVCVHDLQHLTSPQFFERPSWDARNRDYGFAIRRADRLIAISHQESRYLDQFYGRRNVDIVHHGPYIADYLPKNERDEQRSRGGYVIYPAVQWPHKNHANLVYAWAIYQHAFGGRERLVLTGASEHDLAREGLAHLISKLGLSHSVEVAGYQTDAGLATLICEAKALLFPSLYEGFGIPVLEAMYLGTPVLATRLTSLEEVGADAIEYFGDAQDPYQMACDIQRFLRSEERLGELGRLGSARARAFSTERMAAETLESIARAASGGETVIPEVTLQERIPPFENGPVVAGVVLCDATDRPSLTDALDSRLRRLSLVTSAIYCYVPTNLDAATLSEVHALCSLHGAKVRATANMDEGSMAAEALSQFKAVEERPRYVLIAGLHGEVPGPLAVRTACAELDYFADLGAAFFENSTDMSIGRPPNEAEAYEMYMTHKDRAGTPFYGAMFRCSVFSDAGVPGTKKFLAFFLKSTSYIVVTDKKSWES